MMKYSIYISHAILLGLTLLNTSCATQGVSSMIRKEEGLNRELSIKGTAGADYARGQTINIAGEYYGLTSIDGKTYHIIKLKDIRANCGQNHDALLYLGTLPSVKPFIKESAGFEGRKLQDVDVAFVDARTSHNTDLFCSFYKSAASIEWVGFPGKLRIYYANTESAFDVQFRYGRGDLDTCTLYIENSLEWECRSKTAFYATHALYPFSVVYDTVTLPLQWLLWMIFM